MSEFSEGDRVRIDIPDTADHDHERFHGLHGTIVDVLEDEAGNVTGDERDAVVYEVDLENGEKADFRWRDLRPPVE